VASHATVADLPVAVALRNYARVTFDGDPAAVRALVRSMLAQAVTFHSPDEIRVSVCVDAAHLREWDWIKWLPHALHPDRTDAAGELRLVRTDLDEIEGLLGEDLAQRPRFRPGPAGERAHHVIVVDGGRVGLGSQLASSDALGVTVLDLHGVLGRDTDQHVLRLRLEADGISTVNRLPTGETASVHIGQPDSLSINQVDALAHLLARYRSGAGANPAGAGLSGRFDLPSLLGVGDLAEFDAQTQWQRLAGRDRLRVPIGVTDDGTRVELDLKEAAQAGMGPHGLIVGATGSGKSELLRTLVAGLALTHSSEQLNFVLADFKGGATFLGLESLPHVCAVITNLADELPLVDRMQDALRGEIVRRQELLRSAGNLVSTVEYDRARAQGAPLAPLPTLLVVVDEFTELLVTKPEFGELFVMIGRLGRSLGVHLLLASQRFDEGRMRGLETHLSYRICLRTFSASESRMVLGVPDAHTLPAEPGHGYLKHDVTSLIRFKAAYVSGLHDRLQPSAPALAAAEDYLVPFVTDELQLHRPAASTTDGDAPALEPEPAPVRVLDLIVNRLRGQGPMAHAVWLPPLREPPTLAELLPELRRDPVRGLTAAPPGPLSVPVGVIDLPFEQRRAPLVLDLAGAGGHVAVVGGPQSGKSTLLRTLIAALALTHTPQQVQCYCLDFGGGALAGAAGLPHVGGVATRLQPELVRRTVAELTALLTARERRFAAGGYDSMAAYRGARQRGEVSDDHGDVFLVIDGMTVLRSDFDTLEPSVINLAVRGLSYGIHVVVTATRWAELRPQLRDALQTRLELRLGDAFESEIGRHAAHNVPVGAPGRGLVREGLHFLAALPRLDNERGSDDLARAVATLTESVSALWPGAPAPAVRMLPEVLSYADLQAVASREWDSPSVLLGLSGEDLAPVAADFGAEPHLLIFGDSESGKSNLLRAVAQGIVATYQPAQARIVVLDVRRSLLDAVPSSHLITYSPDVTTAAATVVDIRDAVLARRPGPGASPEQMRNRDWWQGPELYLLVDDYDLLIGSAGSPLTPLDDVLAQSRDLGFHLVLARASGGAGRAMFEPVLQRLRELATPGIVLSGSPQEGPLVGTIAPMRLPPGRGRYYHRRRGVVLLQTPLC
jgi:S-DNA-T family DNA segregation ATPase FtsK/SpoIIIE